MDGQITVEQGTMALVEVEKEKKDNGGNKREFSTKEAVLSLLFFVLSFGFTHFAVGYIGGIWGGVVWLLTGVLGAVYVRVKGFAVAKGQFVLFCVAEAFCLVPLFCTNGLLNTLAATFTFLLLAYLGISLSGAELFGENFVADLLEAICVQPFTRFAEGPLAAKKFLKNPKSCKTMLYVVLGLLCSLPLSIMVFYLLMWSDAMFADKMESLFDMMPSFEFRYVWELIFAVPVWLYVFGGLAATQNKRTGPLINIKGGRVLPAILGYTMVTPICIFYVMYIAVQFNYFTAAFGGTLPGEYSYSSYARKGFFELCAIAVINLCVIACMNLFLKRKEDGSPSVAMKVYCTLLSGFTVLLIVSAISKMVLYINEMGMTPLRIYTSWFMLVLAVFFVLIIAAQFTKLRFCRAAFVSFTLLFAVLCFSNVDGMIAKYNVNAYRTGKLERVDFGVLERLGDAALVHVERLTDAEDRVIAEEARECYKDMLRESGRKSDVAYFSIPRVIGRSK